VATEKTFESELPWVLDELCVELGLCLRLDERTALEAAPPTDVDAFTDAVFIAEGLDPSNDRPLRRKVRDKVQRRLGPWMTSSG
jgi:hypothetical protein